MKKNSQLLALLVCGILLGALAGSALAQDRAVRLSERFAREGQAGKSLLDRSRILKGLMYAADLARVPAETRKAWLEAVQAGLPSLLRDLSPSKEKDSLEAAANAIEIAGRMGAPGLEEKLRPWRDWALGPRFIGPDGDVGRLGLALVLLHGKPDSAAQKYAETQLEAAIDASRYENEMHRFGGGPEDQALAHRLLHLIIAAPVQTVHARKLEWMLVTHYKYLTRKLAESARADFRFEDALLEHGILRHGRVTGERMRSQNPGPFDLPLYFSVLARFESENARAALWLAAAKSRPTPRLVMGPQEWAALIARNKTTAYAADLKKALADAEAARALDVPVYYEPAPNLDERGKTNALSQGVGRKEGPLRAAYLATGDGQWGAAFKDVVMAQVRQFEDYGDFRCYYNLNVPGPWDGLSAVVSDTNAYDLLAAKNLLSDEEKDRLILMIREIGHELAWTLARSNFIVHNAWGRWMGSLGVLVSYWPDIPEAGAWRTLVESRLPFLYTGIDKDGGWYEKTVAYHLFTLDLVKDWFRAARRLQGIDLFDREINGRRLSQMLDWVVKITPPGGELPLFNDAQKLNVRASAQAMDMAAILGRGDFFKAIYFRPAKPALTEPDRPAIAWKTPGFGSILMEESGYGIFRSGWEPDDFYAALKFGEHGGGHGHFDKASLYVHAFGRPWLIDPGYGQRETFKHNTVVVDEKNQDPAAGTLLAWRQGAPVDLIAVSHHAYPSVRHRRAVFRLPPSTLLVADVLDPLDGQAHVYDWMLQLNADNGTSGAASWKSTAQGSALKVLFPGDDPAGTRELAPARNVNELPSNYVKMGNENLYLEIWRGKWTKKTEGRAVFAAAIEPFRKAEPQKSLSQKTTGEGVLLELKDGGRTQRFEWRLADDAFFYTGPDGRKISLK